MHVYVIQHLSNQIIIHNMTEIGSLIFYLISINIMLSFVDLKIFLT